MSPGLVTRKCEVLQLDEGASQPVTWTVGCDLVPAEEAQGVRVD